MPGPSPLRKHLTLSTGERIVVAVLVVAAAAAAGYFTAFSQMRRIAARVAPVNPGDATEIGALRAAYGPDRNSEHWEEWIVRDFFKDARSGVFVDVGANHHQRFSNTYYLETVLGWSGVALEPQKKFAGDWARYRPKTTFVPLFVSDVSNREATLYVTGNDLVASSSREFTEAFGSVTPTTATTTTLDDVLDRLGITRIDFLSMDIEMAEPQALAGFSIERFRPRLVAVEAHPPIRQQLLDYFARHGYTLVGKYWRIDSENFWFAPLVDTATP
ncbi:MAG: FkbM family methyltransferase [Acidobacteria bacterium]|nr:FkbM family methyltransferase [Acidobacteriota bacterium]